uniref:Uncharacterized protein n=1 Tax=Avena sativa TaxID=4498 RepID=A0ACD5ZHN8_AVESA
MFGWGKSSSTPGPAVAGGEVAVHKVDKIDYVNLVHAKPPVHGGGGAMGSASWKTQPWTGAKKPESSGGDDINSKAGRFIEDTKNRWRLGLKSFRATGGR